MSPKILTYSTCYPYIWYHSYHFRTLSSYRGKLVPNNSRDPSNSKISLTIANPIILQHNQSAPRTTTRINYTLPCTMKGTTRIHLNTSSLESFTCMEHPSWSNSTKLHLSSWNSTSLNRTVGEAAVGCAGSTSTYLSSISSRTSSS